MAKTKELIDMVETVERNLREIREIIRKPLEGEFARGNLTGPQTSVMQVIFQSQGMTLKDLCRRVGLAHSTTSGIVDRLAARGLLERKVSTTDRRFTVIDATPVVREFMAKQAPRLLAKPLAAALKRTSPAERDLILRGLETLRKALEAQGSNS
jgi:MarR family transcriptional regulator, organic hydroperoxide resistance regulator